MAAFHLSFFLFIIFTNYLNTDALFEESLVSANYATSGEYTYNVAIMGKKNFTFELTLQCGGGIIKPDRILTAAQCFIDEHGNLKELTFSIIVDEINVKQRTGGFEVDIDLIYLPQAGSYYLSDIAISKLQYQLYINIHPNIVQLVIPYANQEFRPKIGIVAGYGYTWYNNKTIYDTDGILRYANVRILSDIICKEFCASKPYATFNMFCGQMLSYSTGYDWGICKLDAGSPLVFRVHGRDVVAGVASTNNLDCNDEIFGGLYTDVKSYLPFINGVLSGFRTPGTIVHINRPHVGYSYILNSTSEMIELIPN